MKLERTFICRASIPVAAALLAGCAANGASQLPSVTKANLSANVLQFAVGTANIGQDGVVGLNVVTTLRQPSGASAVLANQPTLTFPAGMLVPAGTVGAYGGANVDAGTNHVSGSPQVPLSNTGLIDSTLGTFTGVFSYGFGPFNCDQTCSSTGGYYIGNPNGTTGNGFDYSIYDGSSIVAAPTKGAVGDPTQPLPFFSADPMDYVVGPPAVTNINNGKYPVGFAGFPAGFTAFEVPPATGSYGLSVLVPATNVSPVTYTANATLASKVVLGPISVTFISDANHDGGGTGTVTVPAGVTETEVFIVDQHTDPASGAISDYFYSVGPLTGSGPVNYTLPANVGPCTTNCPQPTIIAAGDQLYVAAVGYDYPAFEAGPPGNTSQKPTIAGANGQADITLSKIITPTY